MPTIYLYYTSGNTSTKQLQPATLDAPLALSLKAGVPHIGVRSIVGELAKRTDEGWTVAQPIMGGPRCYLEGLRLDPATGDFTIIGNRLISPYWVAKRGDNRLVVDYEY